MPYVPLKPTVANGAVVTGQTKTVGTAVVSLSAFNANTNMAVVQVNGNSVYVTFDGTAPSSSNGAILYAGNAYHWDAQTAQAAKFLAVGAAATIFAQELVSSMESSKLPDTDLFKAAPLVAGSTATGTVTQVNTGTGLTGGPITGTGTISDANQAGVTPGTYGDSTHVAVVTVNQQGRITAVSTSAIATSGSGTVTSITAGTGLSGGTITTSGTIAIANTTVSAGTYGSSTQVPQFSVNAQGQITSASNVTIVANGTLPTGGVKYSYLKKNSTTNYDAGWYGPDVLNVIDYGADPTGVSNSYTAIQAAITDALNAGQPSTYNKAVYIPAGTYLCSSTLSATLSYSISRGVISGGLCIFGDGRDRSRIYYQSAGNGMSIDASGGSVPWFNFVDLHDFSILAYRNNGISGSGLYLTYGTSPPTSPYLNGTEAIPGPRIRNMNIGVVMSGMYIPTYNLSGWYYGAQLINAHGLILEDIFIQGGANNTFPITNGFAGCNTGLVLYSCINVTATKIQGCYWNQAIALVNGGGSLSDCQGVSLDEVRFVGCMEIIRVTGTGTTDAISLTNWMLDNGSVGAGSNNMYSVTYSSVKNGTISNGWCAVSSGGTITNGYGIGLASCGPIAIIGNKVEIPSLPAGQVVYITSSSRVKTIGNDLNGSNTIVITGSCSNCITLGNTLNGGSLSDSGTGDVAANNI